MKILKSKEIEAVLNLPPHRRYEHFIKQVADWENVWALYDSDWVIIKDKNGNELFPTFSHKAYAELYIQKNFPSACAKSIALDEFVDDFLTELGEKNIAIEVLPTPEDNGHIVCYQTIYNNLNEELENY